MIKSFAINNFRCFRKLRLDDLARVNLITGKNNVGKTALLEALYLSFAAGIREWPTRINLLRGFENLALDLEAKWGWLFFDKNRNSTIEITRYSDDEKNKAHTLTLSWEKTEQEQQVNLPKAELPQPLFKPRELLLMFKTPGRDTSLTRIDEGNNIRSNPNQPVVLPLGVIFGSRPQNPQEDAMHFSEVVAAGKQEELVNPLKILEPRLKQLSVLYLNNIPMIYADLGAGRLIPLPQMGEGMRRIFSFVLEIVRSARGVVLIDEVENGLHHSVMVEVWRVIAEAARRYDTQIFATTHSWECIQAAHEVFQQSGAYDLAIQRLQRVKGEIQVVAHDQEMVEVAEETGLEIR
jgi:predicted ATP-dependent endonuclease of OLD family